MPTSDRDSRAPPAGRLLCPEHHDDLAGRGGPAVYCRSCGHAYRIEDLLDAEAIRRRPAGPPE